MEIKKLEDDKFREFVNKLETDIFFRNSIEEFINFIYSYYCVYKIESNISEENFITLLENLKSNFFDSFKIENKKYKSRIIAVNAGYGFIERLENDYNYNFNIFFHSKNLETSEEFSNLFVGDFVEFELQNNHEKSMIEAINIKKII